MVLGQITKEIGPPGVAVAVHVGAYATRPVKKESAEVNEGKELVD